LRRFHELEISLANVRYEIMQENTVCEEDGSGEYGCAASTDARRQGEGAAHEMRLADKAARAGYSIQ